MRHPLHLTLAALGVAMSLGACEASNDGSSQACIPGASVACACTDGSTSAQVCKADGSGLEACACGQAPDTVGPGDDGTGPDDEVDVGGKPDTGCVPDCGTRTCGPDGCGGSCGACSEGVCLDGTCCVAACQGKTCGPDGCGGACGTCAEGVCLAGTCCVADCWGRECGPDGCGGSCGACANGKDCEGGLCGGGLGDWYCPEYSYADGYRCDCECGAYDPDCDDPFAPVSGCYGSGSACDATGHCGPCLPSCGSNECGPDGCGGSCGACVEGYCVYGGTCCVPDCDGKQCGFDGCDAECGWCDYGECIEGTCECTPDCAGKECGPDGCGGECGGCGAYDVCVAALCCTPDCTGKECGTDGCGGPCGTCAQGICVDGICAEAHLGTLSRLDAVWIPGTPDETGDDLPDLPRLAGAVCPDVTGDGVPDDGLGPLLGTLAGFGVDGNAELDKLTSDEGPTALLFDFGNVTSMADQGPFPVAGYFGVLEGTPPALAVSTASFDADGQPWFLLQNGSLSDGQVAAGPSSAFLPLGSAYDGLPLTFPLEHARLTATLQSATDAGVDFTGGVLSGLLFKADLDHMLYAARVYCATSPDAPPDMCGYIQMADMPLVETFLSWDLEIPSCGKMVQVYDPNDPLVVIGHEESCLAVSACAYLSGSPAVAVGTSSSDVALGCGCRVGAGGPPLSSMAGAALLVGILAGLAGVTRRRHDRRG